MTKETWKDISNYEGLYQVSDLGRVKRVKRTILQFNHQLQKEIPVIYPETYLKFDKSKGYNRVTLSKSNSQERFQVHRLVAEAFIPNPENKPCVHHINHHSEDNRAVNLQWVTHRENERFKWENKKGKFKAVHPDGTETTWITQMDCARYLGIPRNGIQRCLSGEVPQYRGYRFSHINAH